MFEIKIIVSNDLQELKDDVNDYCYTNRYVVDVDIFQQFSKPRLSDSSIPNGYVAVIKKNITLEGDKDEQ